jgi:ubiquinone/menaquinone biosynthesis C-methylase UbiE
VQAVNYDHVAPEYDRRFDLGPYDGVRAYLQQFAGSCGHIPVLEVGCGTGHWLAELGPLIDSRLVGIDLAAGMLTRARAAAPEAYLLQATATQLPLANETFDRVFCVNALHHFPDPIAFFDEVYRVLRRGGSFVSIGLDPHTGDDSWWIYDYFPAARQADERRYWPAHELRRALTAAGFSAPVTSVAQRIPGEATYEVARAMGLLSRHSTSQLLVITDDEYAAGIARIEAERPMLQANLRLHATRAEKPTLSAGAPGA